MIAHNGILLSVIKYFENLSDDEVNSVRVPNDEILVVNKNAEEFSLERITI